MQQLQPRLQEIQTIYAGDQQKIQEETMKIYQETGFNPLAGCLPLLIQMPIFIVLFQALRYKIGDYATPDFPVSFYNILPDLTIDIQGAWANGVTFAIPYIICLILFIGLSVGPMIISMRQQSSQNRNQTMLMLVMFGAMFIWMGFISPAGVLLYWALSSGFGFAQQLLTNRSLKAKKKQQEEEQPVRPVKVNVERREKKKRPTKKN